jgi:hypothetical protein
MILKYSSGLLWCHFVQKAKKKFYTSISKFTLTNKKATKNLGNFMQDSFAAYYISVFSKTVICGKFNKMLNRPAI